jgi:hypothetical protein
MRFSPYPVTYCAKVTRLGVKTRVFHLGDYRRATMGPDMEVPEDYFFINASATSVMLRQKILKKCREDIYAWLNHENGQVAIYDAVNPLASGRRSLAKEFQKHDVQVSWKCLNLNVADRILRRFSWSPTLPTKISWRKMHVVSRSRRQT